MQFVDVLTEDDDGTQNSLVAVVESVRDNLYTVRYLSPTRRTDIYKFEKVTYDIELQSINYFYDGLKDFGFTETADGWLKISESDDSNYSASDEPSSESESDTDESLEEEIS